MYQIKTDNCASAVLAGIFLFSFNAEASTIESTAGVDMRYTDNVKLVPEKEVSDLIMSAVVGAKIDSDGGPFQFNANTSLRYQHYTRDTFRDQKYFNLGATASWAMFKNRLDWNAQDFFSQQPINILDPSTPNNIQDANVFTFGPNIHFPISARQSITLLPEYRNFTYEVQNIDNQQNLLNAKWSYRMFPTLNVGLMGEVNNVDYDEEAIIDKTFRNIHLIVSRTHPRSIYSVKLGLTRADVEGGGSVRGLTGDVIWERDLSSSSNLYASISSDVTDTNRDLLKASRNPETGDFSNEQISTEILRNSVLRLTYKRADAKLKSSVWGELGKQDYDQALLDRDVQVLGVKFDYSVTATVSAGVYTHYNHMELTDAVRRDNQYTIGGNINYRLSRKLHSKIDLKYRNKDSTLDLSDFTEASIFVSLVYGYGQVTRANNIGGGL